MEGSASTTFDGKYIIIPCYTIVSCVRRPRCLTVSPLFRRTHESRLHSLSLHAGRGVVRDERRLQNRSAYRGERCVLPALPWCGVLPRADCACLMPARNLERRLCIVLVCSML